MKPTSAAIRPPHWLSVAALLALTVGALWMLGRNPICECGTVKLWHGETLSSENSQHVLDWYSPSHVLHGLVFYAGLHYAVPRLSVAWRLVIAVAIEAAWEVIENTSWIIEKYREDTIALDYFGDSILNSASDIAMMMLGFFIAARVPVWASLTLFVAAELIVGWFIRDGLILNIVMLIYPLDIIRNWQSGA